MSFGYRPEIDIIAELGLADTAYLHSLIGVLRWIVKLGSVNSCVEASMLFSHIVLTGILLLYHRWYKKEVLRVAQWLVHAPIDRFSKKSWVGILVISASI